MLIRLHIIADVFVNCEKTNLKIVQIRKSYNYCIAKVRMSSLAMVVNLLIHIFQRWVASWPAGRREEVEGGGAPRRRRGWLTCSGSRGPDTRDDTHLPDNPSQLQCDSWSCVILLYENVIMLCLEDIYHKMFIFSVKLFCAIQCIVHSGTKNDDVLAPTICKL